MLLNHAVYYYAACDHVVVLLPSSLYTSKDMHLLATAESGRSTLLIVEIVESNQPYLTVCCRITIADNV